MAKLISRREFLKGTAAGAFSFAAASVLGQGIAFADDAAAIYTPGTYSATAKGLESDITVTMTFDETSIIDVANANLRRQLLLIHEILALEQIDNTTHKFSPSKLTCCKSR